MAYTTAWVTLVADGSTFHATAVLNHATARFVIKARPRGKRRFERTTADGAAAICLPCVLCRKELDKYDVRWTAYNRDGETVSCDEAPQRQDEKCTHDEDAQEAQAAKAAEMLLQLRRSLRLQGKFRAVTVTSATRCQP